MQQDNRKSSIGSVESRARIHANADKMHEPQKRMLKAERSHWEAIIRHRPYNEWPPHDLRMAEILARLMARAERNLRDPDIDVRDIGLWVSQITRMRVSLNLNQVGKGSSSHGQTRGRRHERGRQIEEQSREAKIAGLHLIN